MVAREDHSVGLLYGNPTGGLKGLGGFVDEERVVVLSAEQGMAAPARVEAITRALSMSEWRMRSSNSSARSRSRATF